MPTPVRTLLADVPRVHFYEGGEQSPEDVPFPSCLAACLRYAGEDYPWLVNQREGNSTRDNYANIHILAHSGMAFGLRWRNGWHMDNADHMMVADPSEVIRRAFAAVGYTYEIVHKTGTPTDEDLYRQKVRESLNRGWPVLTFGVVGPPECCLITGYDEGGEVVMGWNFFQGIAPFSAGLAFEPTGQFRRRNWVSDTWSLIIIGGKTALPAVHQMNRDTLKWAVQIARTPKVYDHHTGHAAYSAWAAQLADDAAFTDKDEAALREQHDVHNNVVGILAECRWWGARWLRHIAATEPTMSDALLAAAQCFEKEHDLMWDVWRAAGGNGHPDAWRALVRPDVRERIVSLIRQAQDQDVRATALLERALGADQISE